MSKDLLSEGPFVGLHRSDLERKVIVKSDTVAFESQVLGDVKRSVEDSGVKLVVAYASDNQLRISTTNTILLTSPDRHRSRVLPQGPRRDPRHPRPC